MKVNCGRLRVERFGDSDCVVLEQTHRNGSDEVVGTIHLDQDELANICYLLLRASQDRFRSMHPSPTE